MTDTVTDRPPPPPPAPAGGFDLNQPTIVSLLYLASFVTGVTGLVGLVLAYVWRNDTTQLWEESHYRYLIRTFWFGLLGMVIGVILSIVLIGIPIIIAVSVWVIVRSVIALLKAQKHEPMPDPETLWV